MKYKLGIFSSLVGFSIWIYVICTTSVWWIAPSYEFGLFQILPFWFWAGLILNVMGILLALEHKNNYLFFLQIISLSLMIWGTPIFVESNARQPDAWIHLGAAKKIVDSGRISVGENWSFTGTELQWPGSFIFGAITLFITGLSEALFLKIFYVLSNLIFLLTLFVFVKSIIKNTYIQKMSIISVLLLNLWINFYFGPLGFSIMFFLLIFISFNKTTLKWKMVNILLFASLTISYFTFSVYLLLTLIGLVMFTYILSVKHSSYRITNVIFCAVLLASWLTFNANLTLQGGVEEFFHYAFSGISEPSTLYSESLMLPELIRYITILGTSVVALMYIIGTRKNSTEFYFNVGWAIVCLVFISLDYVGFGSFEYLAARTLAFGYFFIPILVARFICGCKIFGKFKNYIIVIMVLLLLVNLSTLYYFENKWLISDSSISAEKFWVKHHGLQTLFGSRLSILFMYEDEIHIDMLSSMHILHRSYSKPVGPAAIIFDTRVVNSSGFVGNEVLSLYSKKTYANQIYSNGNFEIFLQYTQKEEET